MDEYHVALIVIGVAASATAYFAAKLHNIEVVTPPPVIADFNRETHYGIVLTFQADCVAGNASRIELKGVALPTRPGEVCVGIHSMVYDQFPSPIPTDPPIGEPGWEYHLPVYPGTPPHEICPTFSGNFTLERDIGIPISGTAFVVIWSVWVLDPLQVFTVDIFGPCTTTTTTTTAAPTTTTTTPAPTTTTTTPAPTTTTTTTAIPTTTTTTTATPTTTTTSSPTTTTTTTTTTTMPPQ